MIHTRELNDLLLTHLRAIQVNGANCLVGDMAVPMPVGGVGPGWTRPGPNAPGGSFTPYLVLVPLTIAPAPGTGSIGEPQGDWHCPFGVQGFGAARDQAQWMLDLARDRMQELKTQILDLGDAHYKVSTVWQQTIGGVNRVPQTDPPYFGGIDQVTLWLSKRRT